MQKLALAAATLAVLIAAPAGAQQPPGAPQFGQPQIAQSQTAQPGADALTMPNQSRRHFVPQHFARDGSYVPPHYEGAKKPPFRGYFADKEAERARARQHGYQEPPPDYGTPADGQPGQGR